MSENIWLSAWADQLNYMYYDLLLSLDIFFLSYVKWKGFNGPIQTMICNLVIRFDQF